MDFVTSIFETLQQVVSSIGSLIGGIFESVIDLIYTPGADGGITVVGVLLIIGSAVGLFFFAFRWIRSLIKVKA